MNSIFVEFLKKYLHIQTDFEENTFQEYVFLISEKFFFEYFFPNNFYEVLITDNLYYLILSKNKHKLFIFDKSLKFKSYIDLTAIKKIYADGKYSFILHFYEDLFHFAKLKISFFSVLEKERFLKDIFTDKKDDKDFLLKKIILLNFLSRNDRIEMSLVNSLIMLLKKILKRKSNYYWRILYNKDVNGYFDYNTTDFSSINIPNNNRNITNRRSSQFELNFIAKKFSKKLFFVFNNYKVYDYFFRKIFYGINIIKYKYKKYKAIFDDCVLRDFEYNINIIDQNTNNSNFNNFIKRYDDTKMKNYESNLLEEFFNKNDFKKKLRKAVSIDYTNADSNFLNYLYEIEAKNKSDKSNKEEKDLIKEYNLDKQHQDLVDNSKISIDRSNSEDEPNRNVKRPRHNVEHKKLKNYSDEFSDSKNSLEDSISLKTDFEKVSFEINICYYFSKEAKVIDVYKDGIFTIYKKGKVINFT